jgi:hypothetical protein
MRFPHIGPHERLPGSGIGSLVRMSGSATMAPFAT